KSPMYALQNVFMNARKFDLPAEEIKEMLPEVVNDLNYTTALIENLLHWAKTQMQSSSIEPEQINLTQLATDTIRQLHLQAEEKSQTVELLIHEPLFAWADANMISLVIRNLVSNAIKFSPKGGHIVVGTVASGNTAGLFVQDSGTGIDAMTFDKIQSNQVYSTPGTQNEKGTGLGLTLCKEFLGRNGGSLTIESSTRKGSKFSFRLPATSNRNFAHKEYAAANNY
ncbi:MAG TPA: HAMP domain-containing sensor histidine kinase, partial [Chitinophagaceae bacterium]